jgi:hypothetical protein
MLTHAVRQDPRVAARLSQIDCGGEMNMLAGERDRVAGGNCLLAA